MVSSIGHWQIALPEMKASVAMHSYYALRRFCPYQGVVQVVDVGSVRAYSTDGRHWQIRIQSRDNRTDVYSRTMLSPQTEQCATTDQFMEALNDRPALPFRQEDRIELWLLHKDTQLPLALIKTRRSLDEVDTVQEATWRPFLSHDSGFRSDVFGPRPEVQQVAYGLSRAQDALERQVNMAARPLPVVQWFQRQPDGGGIGHDGLRVTDELRSRHLPKEAFPELLVDVHWNKKTECILVEDYHRWHAAYLLAHQNIATGTRAWLEEAAHRRPEQLLNNHAMYPEVLNEDAMQVALVSAKLIQSS